MNTERWEYKIDCRQYGLLRFLIFGGIAVFFAVLAVDQLVPGENKYWYAALFFAVHAFITGVTAVRLAIRYFCFKISLGVHSRNVHNLSKILRSILHILFLQ